MTTLLPGFDDQLAARAETLAAKHAGVRHRIATRLPHVRRPHGRALGLSILIAGLAASGAAYASQGLWQPIIGLHRFGQPPGHATANPLPADQLALLRVLRRPQTAADRGAASRYALQFQGGDVIRTNEVRLLTTLPHGSAAVLIPVAKRGPGHLMEVQSSHDLLCLWIRDPVDGGGQQCDTTEQLASGMLAVGLGTRPQLTSTQKATRAIAVKRAQATATRLHHTYIRMSLPPGHSTITTVGVVPDGVAQIRLSHRANATTIAVHHNIYVTTHAILNPYDQVWLDAHGRVIPRLGIGAIRSLFSFKPTKHPGLAQHALQTYNAQPQRRSNARNRATMRKSLSALRHAQH